MIARKLGAITKLNTLEFELRVTNCCWNSPLEPWWGHQLEIFSALLALCAGNSPVTSEFLTQCLVTPSFDVFFDLCLNKWLSKQLRRQLFETSSHSLWRHCNGNRPMCPVPTALCDVVSVLTLLAWSHGWCKMVTVGYILRWNYCRHYLKLLTFAISFKKHKKYTF